MKFYKLDINRMKKYLILLILLFGFSEIYSQITVSVSDTTIPRGEIYDIPINITIPENEFEEINDFSIEITYDARVINIQNVTGGTEYLMQCPLPIFINDYEDQKNAILSISCDDCIVVENSRLCIISIQGLVAPDSLSSFVVTGVNINGESIDDLQNTPATIKVPGTPFFQQYPEGLGLNFPNPCHYTTVFPFNINKTSRVEFEMFNASGRKLLSSTDKDMKIFTMYYISKNGVVFITDFNSELDQGSYFLRMDIPEYEISSGLYYMKMKTKSGEYNTNFLILR
jgi:hypothetical protein